MTAVSVFIDVEDPLNPLADDAALDILSVFDSVGVRGSFCLTGEKCRTLVSRGRQDVLEAFKPHCLGLHTDTHSYHPTTMELLADCSFEVGCERAFAAESRGLAAFEAAFGRTPAFWGGAGNTWSPEITDALKRLSIPAYCYALTALPDNAVHQFNGVIALPQALSISESDWADDSCATTRSDEVLAAISDSKQPWLGIFVGHPTRFRYDRFWDMPFADGASPSIPDLATPVDEETYERSKVNLATFFRELTNVVGVDTALNFQWCDAKPTSEEVEYFRTATSAAIRSAKHWPIHRANLDTELILQKTLELESTLLVRTVGRVHVAP